MSTNVITIDGKRYQVTPQGSPEYMASCAVAQANTALIGAGLDQGPMAARVRLLVERHAALREENARMAKGWAMTAKERDEAKSASGSAGKRLGQVAAERDDAIAEAARQRLRADALATAIRRELDQERAARERAHGRPAAEAHHADVISVLERCARAAGLAEHTDPVESEIVGAAKAYERALGRPITEAERDAVTWAYQHTPSWAADEMRAERDAALWKLARSESDKDLAQQERDRARKNWADYKSDLDVALTRIDKAKAVLDRAGVESFGLGLEERIDALAQVCAASDARVAAVQAEADREVASARKRCEAMEDERDVAMREMAIARDHGVIQREMLARKNHAIDEMRAERDTARASAKALIAQVDAADERVAAVRTAMQDETARLRGLLDEKDRSLALAKSVRADTAHDREAALDERDVARAQAENLRAEMQARIDAVTDERDDLKSRESQARATLQTVETALGAALSNQPGTLSKRVTILIAERDEIKRRHEVDRSTLESAGASLRGIEAALKVASPDCVRPGSLAQRVTALASERDAAVARCEDLQKCTKVLVDANLTLQRTMWVVRGEHASTLDDQTSGSGVPLADEQTRAMDRAVYKWAKVEPTAPPRVELVTFADRTRILHHAAPDREVAMTVEDARELWRDLGHALNEADSRAARARNAGEG